MLSKILYVGYQLLKIEFVGNKTDTERGNFELKYTINDKDEIFKNFSEFPIEDNSSKILSYPAKVEIVGHDEEGSETTFSLVFDMELYFDIPDSVNINPAFLEENSWFFDNFVALSIRECTSNIFMLTRFKSVSLPFNRLVDDEI